jgi:AcrR family transcriptional regulator
VTPPSTRDNARARIVDVAARLLHEHGAAALTTRGVAEASGVQAPTIYRLFGDKDGLLEAVAEHVMASHVAVKSEVVAAAEAEDTDPLEDLRAGWDSQIAFGLGNPALFRLVSDWDRARRSPAARSGRAVLAARVHRVARAGRLRTTEQHAVDVIAAAGIGTVQVLLSVPPEERDPTLAEAMWNGVLAQILTEAPAPADDGAAPLAVALRAHTAELDALSASERTLLAEWLERIADAH